MKKTVLHISSLFMSFILVLVLSACAGTQISRVSQAVDALIFSKARHITSTTETIMGPIEGALQDRTVYRTNTDYTLSGDNVALVGNTSGLSVNGNMGAYVKDGYMYNFSQEQSLDSNDSEPVKYMRQKVDSKAVDNMKSMLGVPRDIKSYVSLQTGVADITIDNNDIPADVFTITLPGDVLNKLLNLQGRQNVLQIFSTIPQDANGQSFRLSVDVPSEAMQLNAYECRLYFEGNTIRRYEYSLDMSLYLSKCIGLHSNSTGYVNVTYHETDDILQTGDSIPIDFPVFNDQNTEDVPIPPSISD